jgi:hypothetical protein
LDYFQPKRLRQDDLIKLDSIILHEKLLQVVLEGDKLAAVELDPRVHKADS